MQPITLNATCRHCSQSTPYGTDFCCAGCASVYDFLVGYNLDEYYNLRRCETNEERVPPVVHAREHYLYCDDPEFLKNYSQEGNTVSFYIEGLHCASCVWLLEKLPQFSPDTVSARLDLSRSVLIVQRKEGGSFAEIAATLDRIGYKPKPVNADTAIEKLRHAEDRLHLLRMGIAGAAAGNIMFVAIANYAGAAAEFRDLFTWVSTAFALPVLTFSAWPLYSRVWSDLKNHRVSLDLPIVLALVSGLILSFVSIFRGEGQVYFDSLTILVFLLMTSRYLLRRAQNSGLDISSRSDLAFLATIQRKKSDGSFEWVSSLALRAHDIFLPSPQMTIPCDGRVLLQAIWVDRSVLTGESEPVMLNPGDAIEAGVIFLNGTGEIEVEATGTKTRMSRLITEATWSANSKPKFIRNADRIGQAFTAIVLALAVGIIIYFFYNGQGQEGLERALALVIVSCPCVFGMAIPLALSLTLKKAAAFGVIVRDSEALENLLRIKNIFFDKTGTLTKGKMKVVRIVPLVTDPDGYYLAVARAMEKESDHPVAVAIRNALVDIPSILPAHFSNYVQDIAGGGRRLEIAEDLYEIRSLENSDKITTHKMRGEIGLFKNGQWILNFVLQDELRAEAKETVAQLSNDGLDVAILSGDTHAVVSDCATALNISSERIYSRQNPEQKALCINNCENAMMIGDGVNDAGALTLATVGVALRGSIELSMKSAQIYLLKPDLKKIPWLFQLARQVHFTTRVTLGISLSFNIIAAYLAIAGFMNPLLAAILMPASSFTVFFTTLYLSRIRHGEIA
jgi:heavy metal translocating P-type ATPase